MNEKKAILEFLEELSLYNTKEWMDANRSKYTHAKAAWLEQIEQILLRLSKHDAQLFGNVEPKNCISRITNNRIFNPNLPIYKTFFTFSVMDKSDIFSPLHLSVGVEGSFVGCGYHSPEKQTLKNIRDAIDYEGQTLHEILENPPFKQFFGGLSNFTEPLKTSPKGYDKDHPYVQYLRHKDFTVARNLSHEEIIGNDFINLIEEAFVLSAPFREFLKKANSF